MKNFNFVNDVADVLNILFPWPCLSGPCPCTCGPCPCTCGPYPCACDTSPSFPARALQRKKAENLKQIFPEKEYQGLSPNFHIHASVNELYIPTMSLPFLLEEICEPILGKYKSLTDT
jgi:hypothetical protein